MSVMSSGVVGLPPGPLTRAVLASMPEDGHRYELIDGSLIVSPAPHIRHQRAVLGLYRALLDASPAGNEVLVAPVDVVLDDDTVIQPDVIVAPAADFTDSDLPGPPLLAVEVLSPSTRGVDLLLKRERLRIAGCAHYWVFDPDEPSLIAWTLIDDDYVEVARARGSDTARIERPFAVDIVPAALI